MNRVDTAKKGSLNNLKEETLGQISDHQALTNQLYPATMNLTGLTSQIVIFLFQLRGQNPRRK